MTPFAMVSLSVVTGLFGLWNLWLRRRLRARLAYRRFPDANPAPVIHADRDGGITYANLAARELISSLGSAPDRLPDAVRQRVEVALEKGAGILEGIRHEQQCFDFDLVEDGASIFLYGHDVTSRLERDRQLRDNEARKGAMLEAALDCIITIDIDGKVVEFNPAAEQTFGYQREEILGRCMAELIVPEHLRAAHQQGMATYRETGKGPVLGQRIEVEALRADGTVFPVELAITPIRLESGTLFTAYLRDITQRVESKRELEAASRAAVRANDLKTRFLASMSHEIRTPMTAIVGYSDLVSAGSVDPTEQSAWIRRIQQNAEYLLSLLDNVLDLSKIEAGELYMNEEPCSIHAILEDIDALMRPKADDRLLELTIAFETPIPLKVITDPVRVRQILVNLATNAIKYTETGSVRLAVSYAPGDDSVGRLEFAVTDTGAGIPAESLETIFRPFTQLSSSGVDQGTGLGLDISRRLAEMLGGALTVESEIGVGSTFRLALDVKSTGVGSAAKRSKAATNGTPRSSADATSELAGVRILVVDDVVDNVQIARYVLERSGAAVDVAANGMDCIEAVMRSQRDAAPYHVVLMDMQMPVMDGYEATEQLRLRGIEIPIIALTAFALVEDHEKCIEAGCNAYLSKPVVPAHLCSAVRAQLPEGFAPTTPERLQSTRIDDADFADVLAAYIARVPTVAADIHDSIRTGDAARTLRLVHGIKGSAGGYGFPQVTEVAARCEATLRDRPDLDPEQTTETLAPLLELLERVSASDEPAGEGS